MQQHYRYNGFINVYKESGWTSMDVCAKLKHVLGVRKIGHAGTLDPMAEGVLPVAVGRATKDISRIGECVKEYRAGMLLGTETDTEDITGNVTARFEGTFPDEEAVRRAILSFVGEYDQLTPMYSARKVNGKKLYEYARAGKEVERKSKKVSIYSISIDKMELDRNDDKLPHVDFTVRCSQGTYIRSLCRDIGARLGCGACMDSLVRSRVGDFGVADAVRIADIQTAEDNGSVDSLLRVVTGTAISIGKFDGTHVGHQALLRELRRKAEQERLRTLVLILKFGRAGLLSDEDRKDKLYGLGIDYCMELEFTEEMRNMSASDFLEKILIGRYSMKALVAGKDVSFGRGKEGNAEFLQMNADKYGYSVDLIDKIRTDERFEPDSSKEGKGRQFTGSCDPDADMHAASDDSNETEVISSTLLRKLIAEGDMARAARLLGSNYSISGPVVHGKGMGGSEMSYPTMNIEVPDSLTIPPNGVYAVKARIYDKQPKGLKAGTRQGTAADSGSAGVRDGKLRKAASNENTVREVLGIANLGERPTVHGSVEGGTRLRLEVHAFDDIGDCYGRQVRVELLKFIRPERKFDSLSELVSQISEHDVPETNQFFREQGYYKP